MPELKQVDKVDFQHAAYKANIGLWSKCRTVAATFGYLVAGAFPALVLGGVGAVLLSPDRLPLFTEFASSTTPKWLTAFAVLGVIVWWR